MHDRAMLAKSIVTTSTGRACSSLSFAKSTKDHYHNKPSFSSPCKTKSSNEGMPKKCQGFCQIEQARNEDRGRYRSTVTLTLVMNDFNHCGKYLMIKCVISA